MFSCKYNFCQKSKRFILYFYLTTFTIFKSNKKEEFIIYKLIYIIRYFIKVYNTCKNEESINSYVILDKKHLKNIGNLIK